MIVGGRNIATFGPKYQSYTPYQKMQIQRYVMGQAAQRAAETSAIFSSNIFGAMTSLSTGLAELSVKAMIKRSQDELAAKQDQLKSSLDILA